MPLDSTTLRALTVSVPEVFSAVSVHRNIGCDGSYSAISDCFICATLPMPDEDGHTSDADMIVYFDVMAMCHCLARSWHDDGERAEGDFKIVGVGYDGQPGPALTDADKSRLVAWFDAHHDEATEIATDWMEDCR